MKETVAAVVVTYNRKDLLVKCLEGVLGQTHPVDRIFIIDNASTDGTYEHLDSLGFIANPLIEYVRLPENTGGAGGFHVGVRLAHEAGFQWVWLMDDDGRPDADSLINLLSKKDKSMLLNPLVLSDEETLSFPFSWPGHKTPLGLLEDVKKIASDGCVMGVAFLFNGTLISRKLIDKVGCPKKEFFIWGDEVDYLERCRRAGVVPITVCSAKHFHPPSRANYVRVPFRMGWVCVPDDDLRLYLVARNQSYIRSRYPSIESLKFYVKYFMYSLFNVKRGVVIIRGIVDGLFANWKASKPGSQIRH